MIFSKSIFPLLPPYAQDPNAQRVVVHPDGMTPYLGLRARLSQVWLNRWTILSLLVLARVLLAVVSLHSDMDDAQREALSACTAVESMGSSMASMPHYLSRGVNELTASSVEAAVHGLKVMLMLTLTGVEELVIFFIKVMYQTYLCLFTLVVRGSAHIALGVLQDATDFLNSTIKTIGEDIHKTVDTFESGLDKFIDGINGVTSIFGGNGDVPKLDISSSLDELTNLRLPGNINSTIDKLNSSIPTFDEVDKFVVNVLRAPFEEVKHLVNRSLSNYTFDRSTLPVPAKEQMTFCNDNNGINSFFDHVADLVDTARKIFIAVLVLVATLACVPAAWNEIRRWRSMKERSQLVRKDAHDPMDVVHIVSRPYSSAAGIKAASRFSNSRRQTLVRWVVAYATSTPALFVLSLALAGLFSCLCQFLLLRTVQKTVPELTTEVGQFADKVVGKLENTSAEWARDANGVISHMNHDLNDNILGWVNTSTTALNETLDAFIEKTTGVLNDTFGGTVLLDPLQEVFRCLIGLKVESVQKGLTWVHDHAHINFPNLPNDTEHFLADPGDSTSNKVTEVVIRVVQKVEDGIRTETIIASCILLVWVLNALFGLIRALTLFWNRDRTRGNGGGGAPPISSMASNPDANGFIDVPLTAIPKSDAPRSQPAPRYEASPAVVGGAGCSRSELEYEDEKLGFAGQRNYGSALKVNGTSDLRGSSYVEYGMEKR
ncbi:pheromone-regulated protein PRM1 [Aspergillus tanneri]|uniref:Plasma membrane fusion protein PRM1 n=1 Tax=Aspergillus tanneri TaxID=1220188 RepID=A0A5M9MNV4_9EURO|nr:plasma membrane fusion protein prm1 [Aspergillus tanneri]KAA8648722.1 plasma membrane fusion protein prm1 [Aspergillus tanneri]